MTSAAPFETALECGAPVQVYAAEAQASKLKPEPVAPSATKHDDRSAELEPESLESTSAKHGVASATLEQDPVKPVAPPPAEKGPAKQAEEAWNEQIKGAYAAIAASTPYRPASKKPSSNALSWHRSAQLPSDPAVPLSQVLLTWVRSPFFHHPRQAAEKNSREAQQGTPVRSTCEM